MNHRNSVMTSGVREMVSMSCSTGSTRHSHMDMAEIEAEHGRQLCEWIGGEKSFSLLYQASRDECSAQVFHQKCDNQGATVTLCYNTAGYVFGGYTTQNWTSIQGETKSDKDAFLFVLDGEQGEPMMFPVRQNVSSQAIVNNIHCGPIFGQDLQVNFHQRRGIGVQMEQGRFQYGNSARGSFNIQSEPMKTPLNGIQLNMGRFGQVYDSEGLQAYQLCGNNLQLADLLIYRVGAERSTGVERPLLKKTWRGLPQNTKALKIQLEKYSPPGCTKVKAINLLLLGPVGAGKSSFFNSVNSIFQKEITTLARCGSAEKSLTTNYRRYRVRSSETGETLKLRLCDTRGLETDGGLDLVDLMAVIEGHVPDRFQFNPTVPINSSSTGYNGSPSSDDQIHCVAYVIDGTAVDIFPEKILHIIKSLQLRLNPMGIPQIVILTKADKVCPLVQGGVEKMFFSSAVGDLVDQAGQLFGLPGSCVFPVKNYSNEIAVDSDVDLPIMLCLKQVLRYAEDYLVDSMASD